MKMVTHNIYFMKAKIYSKSVLLFIVLSFISCGRKAEQQEQTFIQELSQMLVWPNSGTYSDKVMNSVFDLIRNNPQSLDYKFEEEIPHMHIATSEDGDVRAYSLERHGFGGNPSWGLECKTLIQYRSGESVLYKEVDSFDGYITRIRHIDSEYYLLEDWQGCVCQGERSTTTLFVYKIDNNKFSQVREAFIDRDGVSYALEFSFDDYGGHIELDYENEDSFVIYSIYRKELYVIKGMPLTDQPLKYRQYCWTGRSFELKQDEPIEYYNEKFFIRIEQNSENSWTYKCWNGGVKKGEPSLIIQSGTKQYWSYDYELFPFDEWASGDESSPLGEKYTFMNNGYRYELRHGWAHGDQVDELYVFDPDEMVIYHGELMPVMHP